MAARQEHGAPAQFSETDGRDFSDVTPSPTWVRVRPAVSVFGASMDTVSRLSRQGFRAINIEPAQSILSPIHGRRDGRPSQSPGESGLISAVLDTSVTVIETAGLGAILALVLVGTVYSVWRPKDLAPILTSTLKESTMLMFIIGMSLLFSYVMSYLRISQSAAEWIVALHLSKWLLLAVVLSLVIVLGFFLPPVSIILMTVPILLPPLKAAGFDLVWFGILMTIVMEMGLIHPPVGLNIFVIKNVAPDISLKDLIWGVMPFVGLMFLAVFLICFFPGIATWFPDMVMGAGK